jgi:hypothetical protein
MQIADCKMRMSRKQKRASPSLNDFHAVGMDAPFSELGKGPIVGQGRDDDGVGWKFP